jgi:hypothetical protein
MNDVTATLAPRGLIAAYGRTPLRSALMLDVAVTLANAVAYLAAAGPLGDLLGLPPALLRGTGAFLLAFAGAVGVVATRPTIARGAVYAIVLANLGWVVASVAVAGAGWHSPTTAGTIWILLQAVVVAGFAALQSAALKKAPS